MKLYRLALGAVLAASAVGAQATTVVIIVDPMTLERHAQVLDTPGKDRVLMCMAPPSTSGCTELPIKRKR